jgi:GNAT superfamily N-acetyltransferase
LLKITVQINLFKEVIFIEQTILTKSDKIEIFKLWNSEYPEKLNYHSLLDFEEYLGALNNQFHILIKTDCKKLIGWYFDFIRDQEKWFALILDSKFQGKGLGTIILNRVKAKEQELNGWVIDNNFQKLSNGNPYISPLDFYLKNGFKMLDKQRLELEKISAVKIKWIK